MWSCSGFQVRHHNIHHAQHVTSSLVMSNTNAVRMLHIMSVYVLACSNTSQGNTSMTKDGKYIRLQVNQLYDKDTLEPQSLIQNLVHAHCGTFWISELIHRLFSFVKQISHVATWWYGIRTYMNTCNRAAQFGLFESNGKDQEAAPLQQETRPTWPSRGDRDTGWHCNSVISYGLHWLYQWLCFIMVISHHHAWHAPEPCMDTWITARPISRRRCCDSALSCVRFWFSTCQGSYHIDQRIIMCIPSELVWPNGSGHVDQWITMYTPSEPYPMV